MRGGGLRSGRPKVTKLSKQAPRLAWAAPGERKAAGRWATADPIVLILGVSTVASGSVSDSLESNSITSLAWLLVLPLYWLTCESFFTFGLAVATVAEGGRMSGLIFDTCLMINSGQ